jgi:hypothetical protein
MDDRTQHHRPQTDPIMADLSDDDDVDVQNACGGGEEWGMGLQRGLTVGRARGARPVQAARRRWTRRRKEVAAATMEGGRGGVRQR